MKSIKTIIAFLVTVILLAGIFTGCGNTQTGGTGAVADSGKQDVSVAEDVSVVAESTTSETV